MSRRSHRFSRDRVTAVAGLAALATAVFAIGGAPRWALGAVALLVAAAAAAQVTSRRRLDGTSPLVVALGVATGLTVAQAIPLPPSVSAALSPTGAALVSDSAALTGSADAWRPLSFDAPGTWRAALMLLMLLVLAVVALRVAATERGRYRIMAAVALTAGLAAAVTAIHHVLGAKALYGLYHPHQANPSMMGPLLNPNHLASFLVVGALTALGLLFEPRQTAMVRGLWVGIMLGCVAVALATLSRGAFIGLGAGLLVTTASLIATRARDAGEEPRRRGSWLQTVPLVVVLVCALALVVQVSGSDVLHQLSTTSTDEISDPSSKYAAWASTERLIHESPWVGQGRGAFEPAFTRVHAASSFHTFSHVENEYVQAVVDWGIPGAALFGLALAWFAVAALRRWRAGPIAAGALGALAAVAVHSVVDFGLELPGLAVPVVLLAATVSTVPLRERSGGRAWRAIAVRGAAVLGLGVGIALVVPGWGATVADDHEALEALPSPSLTAGLAALRRHPLDYLASGHAATAAYLVGDPRATRLLNHALLLHPTHPGLHRLAARVLASTGHAEQAMLEYALALRGADDPRPLILEIVAAFPTGTDAVGALPVDYPNLDIITRLFAQMGRVDLTIAFLDRIVAKRPDELDTAQRLLDFAAAHDRLDVAERMGRLLLARRPTLASRLALAQVRAQQGAPADVLAILADVASAHGDVDVHFTAWLLYCDTQLRLIDEPTGRACLRALSESDVVSPKNRLALERRLVKLPVVAPGNAPAPGK